MSEKNKNNAHPDDCMAEYWSRALGISTERLMALVKQVVEERNTLTDLRRRKRFVAQPTE